MDKFCRDVKQGGKRMNPPEKRSDRTPFELFVNLPDWITPELLDETLKTWQPYYNEKLTPEDGIEILRNIGRIIDILQ
jgi:hypothetical protein